MPPTPQSATDLVPHLRRCGYGDDQLALPFKFDDVTVPVVAFAGRPWDSWSACIAAVDVNGDSRTSAARVSTLGVPTVFVCHGGGVDWWAMGPSGPKGKPRSLRWPELGAALDRERESLLPSRIYASKLRKPGSPGEQLWFFDAGLMPAVERTRGEALTRLVEDAISGLRGELGTRLSSRQAQEDVYRTVFWLLAAKILHDKSVPNFIRIDLANVDEVFKRIGRHHGETGRFPPFGRSGRSAIDAAAERIASCGSLADVSSESLAHVYENALIDKTAGRGKRKKASKGYDIRKELGIHSTPSVLISHMLSQLWPLIEDINPEDRHVFEPACGHAPFLTAAMRWLRDFGGADASGDSHQYLRSHLHGLETDPFALELAKLALTLADEPHGNRWALAQGDMFVSNVLAKHAEKARILLANPPYERFTEEQRRNYERRGEEIASQTKAVEMLKRALPALSPGSVFGVVTPQGLLHDKESRPVREFLRNEFELTEIDVFADNLFEHSDHEVAVLLGRKKKLRTKPGMLWYRRVREQGMEAFKERLAFSSERQVPQSRFAESADADLRVPERDEVWAYLSTGLTLHDLASVAKGLDHKGKTLPAGCWTVRDKSAQTGVLGYANVDEDLAIYGQPSLVKLNLEPRAVLSYRDGKATGKPQVLLNYAPVARGAWKLKATLDEKGRALTSRFVAIRPKPGGPSALYLWAIMNSPVANAFAYDHLGKRDILVGTMRKMPVPERSPRHETAIELAARRYRELATTAGPLFSGDLSLDSIKRALLEMDAAVLRAYDLPPRLERQLLDLFTGVERKGVGCDFRGYYPPGFDAYVPLHELISDDYARSTLGRFRETPRTVSPNVLAALRTASEPVEQLEERRRRYAQLSTLLDEWASETDDFDSRVGPMIEQALKELAPRHSPGN
ncbi:MAG TPA: N-6 DNA methylase [Phycisphaerae bacterium]|nr:N-6 DNA methylase [Phycisphaerae bacterium]